MTTVMSPTERTALSHAVGRLLDRHPGPRPFLADGDRAATTDAQLWAALATQVGVAGLVIPEEHGGAGGAYADLAIVAEHVGRRLPPVPFLATTGMATGVLLADCGPQAATLLEHIAAGTSASVAWVDPGSPVAGDEPARVTADLADGCVTGTASCVLSGIAADVLLVPARAHDSTVVVAVQAGAAGMVRRPVASFDLTRDMAEIAFDAAPMSLVCPPESAAESLAVGADLAVVVLAAEAVGAAQHRLDAAVEWSKQRIQFDRPIGSFQSVKHRLVDLLLLVELSRSAMGEAVRAADEHLASRTPATARALRTAASTAKALCGEAAVTVSRESLHLFGGTGFTWEHDAHLYYRRAWADNLLLGDANRHRVRLAAGLGV